MRSGAANPCDSSSGLEFPGMKVSKKPFGPNTSALAVQPMLASTPHSTPMRAPCPECDDLVMVPVLIDRLQAREPARPNAINVCWRLRSSDFAAAAVAPNMPTVLGL